MHEIEPMPPLDVAERNEYSDADSTHSVGWICPACHSVYAIWVSKCSVCVPRMTTALTDSEFMELSERWFSF